MQKALESIVQHYVQQELCSGHLDKLPANVLQPNNVASSVERQQDDELLCSLHQCLEEKGVLKELQGFLRQRLVGVLQGKWPELLDQARTDRQLSPLVVPLVHDFLCSHKLLFTLSVLTTELGDACPATAEFGKLPSASAEKLLQELGVRKDSGRSRGILESYFGQGRTSLLEALLSSSDLGILEQVPKDNRQHEASNDLSLHDKLKNIDHKYADGRKQAKRNILAVDSIDARFRALAMSLEREKQIQLRLAIDKFKEEERAGLRTELETELKFELLRKEKELLSNYEQQVGHYRSRLDQEKQLWEAERQQIQRHLTERRDQLVHALRSIPPQRPSSGGAELSDGDGSGGVWTSAAAELSSGKTETVAGNEADRESKRYFLLQEARLRTTIDKLQLENEELKAGAERLRLDQQPPSKRNRTTTAHPRASQNSSQPPLALDTDVLALLRYQVETQAEELAALRQAPTQPLTTEPAVAKSREVARIASVLQSTDVETFVAEARNRMAAIERDAQGVGSTLSQLQERRGRTERRSVHLPPQPTTGQSSSEKSEARFQFPADHLRRPVQPPVPRPRLAAPFTDLTLHPAFLKLRPSKTDFCLPVQTSNASFLTNYSDQYRLTLSTSPPHSTPTLAPGSLLKEALDARSQEKTGTRASTQLSPESLSRASSEPMMPRSRSEDAPHSSESERKSSSRPWECQERKASRSGALTREKVEPAQVIMVADPRLAGQGEGAQHDVDSESTRRKVRATILAAAGLPPTPSLLLGTAQRSLAEDTSEDATDAEELNVYEEGRIEGGRLENDDFFV